jgi:dienelactone hydrolase
LTRSAFLLPVIAIVSSAFAHAASPREAFLKIIERPRVPLSAETKRMERTGSFEQFHFSFATEAGQRVTGLLVKQKTAAGKLPVVVALHGTGGNKESQLTLLEELAGRGFLAIAIDGRYHGERAQGAKGSKAYVDAILKAYRGSGEHPFLYDTVWDILRLLDWIETRPDADASRVGMIGFSKGGMELYLAAAVDSRIRASVPCIGVQSFRWALDNDSWQSRAGTFQLALNEAAREASVAPDAEFLRRFYDRVAPGIYGDFDGPSMAPLIAPRPLLVINGEIDARTPKPGLLEAVAKIKSAYTAAGASENFQFILQPETAHKVNPESLRTAVDWLVRWLGTPPLQTKAQVIHSPQ